jgi:hypothetical protein
MLKMDEIQKRLLLEVADLHDVPMGAYNLRANGKSVGRGSSANIEITSKEDGSGIDIHIKPGTKNESVHIPVVMSESGMKETVYNDFYIGEGADVVAPVPAGQVAQVVVHGVEALHAGGVDTELHAVAPAAAAAEELLHGEAVQVAVGDGAPGGGRDGSEAGGGARGRDGGGARGRPGRGARGRPGGETAGSGTSARPGAELGGAEHGVIAQLVAVMQEPLVEADGISAVAVGLRLLRRLIGSGCACGIAKVGGSGNGRGCGRGRGCVHGSGRAIGRGNGRGCGRGSGRAIGSITVIHHV